jgi:photosystem II stability/assembly factor-like uncharacterized protein
MIKKLFSFALILLSSQLFSQWTYHAPSSTSGLTRFYLDRANNVLYIGDFEGFRFYNIDLDLWTDITEEGVIGKETKCLTTHPNVSGRIVTGRVNAWFKGYMGLTNDFGATESITFESDGGSVLDVKYCPSDPDTMFSCAWSDITPGDLLKSTDGGQTWVQLSNYLHTVMTEVALHPSNKNLIYVSGDMKVTKSTDGGASWSTSFNGLPTNLGVYCISINPFKPNELLCSNDNAIYKTDDQGDNWVSKHNISAQFISYNPIYQNYVAAITFSPYTLFVSADSGETWQDKTNDFPGEDMRDVAFSKDGTELYILSKHGFYSTPVDLSAGNKFFTEQTVYFKSFPNPFNEKTNLHYVLPKTFSDIKIKIFNSLGQEIKSLSPSNNKPGENKYEITLSGNQGKSLALGIYHCNLYIDNSLVASTRLIRM